MRVSRNSTINVMHNLYSVPPRLRHNVVRVRLYEDMLEVYYHHTLIQAMPRLIGRAHHQVNYRHVIWSLVHKPGAFARYRYREDLYPRSLSDIPSGNKVRWIILLEGPREVAPHLTVVASNRPVSC